MITYDFLEAMDFDKYSNIFQLDITRLIYIWTNCLYLFGWPNKIIWTNTIQLHLCGGAPIAEEEPT